MFKLFLISAIRNLQKNRVYSFINISGLAIGIASAILILLWVNDETTYDKFVPKAERLFQVWVNAEFDGEVNSWNSVPLPTYDAMKDAQSAIVESTVAGWGGDRLIAYEDKRVIQHGYYVGKEFLDMFEFEAVQGDAQQALKDPSSIVITETLAEMLFGKEDPIGKILKVEDESPLQVTAVLKELPINSSFKFEYLIPWEQREKVNDWVARNRTNWGNYSFQVYVELDDPSKEKEVEQAVFTMLQDNGEDDLPRHFFFHPMPRWRLHSQFENGVEAGGRYETVQLFTAIAIFIIIIACINFMNLATARSEKRAREVGIRKSLGSSKASIIIQFLGESLLITTISFALAVILALLALPYYNTMVDKTLTIDLMSMQFWVFAFLMIVVTGVVSGSYPAFFLSSFKPTVTLKGSIKAGKGASLPRKILVILQFGFSILLMVSTVVIYQQIELVQNRELGYDQNYLISVQRTDAIDDNYQVLKNELIQSGMVENVTRSNGMITQINSNNFLGWPGKPEDLRVMFVTIVTEYDYANTMGVEMLQGRDFMKEFSSDSDAIVINKAALDLMNLEDPIGTNLDLWDEKRKLIGVMDNVLMGSPYEPVRPTFMILDDWGGYVSLRLKRGADLQPTLASVEQIFNKHNPAYPFEYKFADIEFQDKFSIINLTKQLSGLFSILAIFITGMGLFGLASFMAEQRTKEIGIRKVLGASITHLIGLISKDFSLLVFISFVITAPLTYFLLDQYLDRYEIRVGIEWWVFPVVGLVALGFALAIVANQAGRAARMNPVKSLRQE
ncbi:MAG: ABC transporter permease [Cyclobacteriaceae bacterium]